MIVRFGLLRRNAAMTRAEFNRHWRDIHGPLAAALPGLREYHQHAVVDQGSHPIAGNWDLDGISELHFDSLESMNAAFAAPSGGEAKEDLSLFLSEVKLVVCEKHRVVPRKPLEGSFIKRMSLIRRRPGLDDATFRHEWLETHAAMMRQWQNVLGYNQNLVIDRISSLGRAGASLDEVPVDGIVEIWFANHETAAETQASPIGVETLAHARAFLSEITPFLVDSHRIL